MGNVATANVQFGIKHNIDQELQGLRAAIERNGPAITRGLTDPIAAADQVLSSLGPKLEKLLSTAAKGLPLSSRMMSELQSSAQTLDRLYGGLSGSSLSTPGLANTLGNLQVARQAVGLAEQANLATQNQAAAIHGVTSNTMPAVGMQLSAQDKMQHAVFQSLWQMAESQRQPMGRGYVSESIHQQAARANVQHIQAAKDRQVVQQAMQQEQQTIAEQRQQYLNNLPRLPHTYQVGQERGNFTGRYLRNTPAPMEHVVDTSNMYPSDWQEYVSAKRGALMLPPEALAQRPQGGVRGRMNKEEQESLQRYREFERSRLMKMDSFDMLERQRQAYNRNMDPYRNSVDDAFDLTTQFNEQDQLRRSLTATGRSADVIVGQHNAEKQAREAILRHNQFQEIAIGRHRFSEINAAESASVSNRKLTQVKQELELVRSLAQEYGKLSEAKRRDIRTNLEAMQSAGISGASLPLRALNQVEVARYGRGNAFRYGSQNAAFALEDYLISSQYGGPKAGIRAITNNLTAIAAAATGSLSPLASAGVIGTVAVAGATAPLVYDWMTGSNDQLEALNKRFAAPRYGTMASFESGMLSQNLTNQGSQSALQAYQKAMVERDMLNRKRADIRRSISPSITRLSNEVTSTGEWFEATMSSAYLGMAGMGTVIDWVLNENDRSGTGSRRSREQLMQIHRARGMRSNVQEQLNQLGDPNVTEQLVRDRERDFISEQRNFVVDSDLRNRSLALQARRSAGELISPNEDYDIMRSQFLRNRMRLQRNWRGSPESLIAELDTDAQVFSERRNALNAIDIPAFERDVRNRQWAFRGRLAGYEVDPVKALIQRSKIEAEQIEADPNYSPQEKKNLISGLMKMTRNGLSSLNKMPDLGGVIEAGSGADIALRQPFFGPRETTKDKDSRELGEIKTVLERIEQAIKNNKPQAADIVRKK